MARIRNNYPYAWSSVQILQCTPNWNIDIKSRTMYIQMLFLAPPSPAQTLHTSCIGQSSSPNHLRKLSVSNTRSFFLSMFRSLSLSTTQPLFPLCYQMYLPHTPAIAPHAELSLSLSLPLSLSPSRAKYMHCLSSPPTSRACTRAHVIYLGHSLEPISLFLPHGGPHLLNLTLFIGVSFNLVFFHTQMIYLPVRASIDTLYTLSRRLSI